MMLFPVGLFRGSTPAPPVFSGVLDSYTTGLWSAFGVKRLLTAYTGPLIRVRRSSDNTEQNIGYLSDGTLDLAALLAFVGSDSAYVTKVYDQSGAINDFIQPAAGDQPRIVNAGTYDGAIRFDGTTDYLQSLNQTPAVSALTVAGRYQLRAAAAGGTTQSIITHNVAAAHNTFLYQQQSNDGKYSAYLFEGDATYLQNVFGTVTTAEVADVLVANKALTGGAKLALWRNGASQSGAAGGAVGTLNFTLETLYIGGISGPLQPAQMNGKWFAVWQASKATDAAAISAAI